ncbi:MAG: sensor histidine kinase [Bacteroidetes bacterium]|nr:sensor histidine kinase [Bacteroidota bacterium]
MSEVTNFARKYALKVLPFLLIIIFGALYLRHTWIRIQKETSENILQVARSIEAAIPKDSLNTLEVNINDLNKPYYKSLKRALREVIKVNKMARFAYLYTQRNGNIYFIVDSEPDTSADYSPPGQEFSEADISDWQPLLKGVESVSAPLTDRWGTWVSVLIPITDKSNGKPIAVFGMDFNAQSFQHMVLVEEMRSCFIILLMLAVLFFFVRVRENNSRLKQEIIIRKEAELTIQHQNEELVELNITKDKFFSIIAHDLRGPFAGFLGLTEILAQTLHTMSLEQIQKFAVSMEKTSKNLYRLLENLLQWSLMQRNVTTFDPQSFLLLNQVTEGIAPTLELAETKEIEMIVNVPAGQKVSVDLHMFNTIIRNLVSNAIKFTPKGGKISISSAVKEDSFIEIAVKDTGIGMPKEMVDNLFRLDVVTSRKGTEGEPSTGLGLILVKDFVEKHKGHLRVESSEGAGSTFYFTIPSVLTIE